MACTSTQEEGNESDSGGEIDGAQQKMTHADTTSQLDNILAWNDSPTTH